MSAKKIQATMAVTLAIFLFVALTARAQRQMERLGRGLVVLHSATAQAYMSWRLLATDSTDVGFNIYRSSNGSAGVKLNAQVITNTTDFLDTTANFSVSNAWYVVPVISGLEQAAGAASGLPANSPVRQYLSWPLAPVAGGAYPPYDVKFCWVGDFDGDGEYDYLVDRLSTTGGVNQYLQAYKRDGTLLWQMDMGYNSTNQYNIEPGASAISTGDKDNVTVYDLDGDGRAEVIVRTARGAVLPDGSTITGPDDTTQYLSILDGLTGHEVARTTLTNLWPGDGPLNGHCGIMYCDGVHPSVIFEGENRNASQVFQRETMVFDYRNGQLTRRWFFTPPANSNLAWGHQIRVTDVNHDGIDDLIEVGSAKNGATGQPLFDTELVHGDRFHVLDIDPDRPGLEMFSIQQLNPTLLATALIDMTSGKLIKKWYSSAITDVGRGIALDIDPAHRGCEFYSTQPGIFDCKGKPIQANSIWPPEGLWWDADLSREFIDGPGAGATSPVVNKYDPASGTAGRLYTIYNDNGGVHQAYGGRPAFWGDILGDWREELVLVANDYSELRVYVTKLAATNRLYCLMQNPQYRDQATCKGYYQASYVDYFLGNDMPPPAPPPISNAKLVWRGDGTNVWDTAATANWFTNWFYVGNANTNPAPFNLGDTVLFDLTGSNNTAITLTGSLTPGEVRVHSPKNYTFNGTGSLNGAMGLTKAGAGKLTFNGTNHYTGKTLVAEGPLVVNGALPNSPVTVRGGVWLDGRLGGTGVVGAAVVINEGAGISPGQGTNSAGTLTIANNLTLAGRTLNDFDLSDDWTGATKSNDTLVVNGNLTLQGTNTLVIHLLNTNLPAGSIYPLINYAGALTGSLNNFTVAGLTGIPFALTNPPGQIALIVKRFRPPATITWTGGQGGNAWDLLVTSNWLNGAAKDLFAPNDTVRFDNTGAMNPTVNLSGDLNCATLVVDTASNYTFTGSGDIIGSANLIKTNNGTLTINSLNNTFTGKTIVAGGTLVVAELDALGFPSPLGNPPGGSTNLILSGNSTLRITGESYTERGLTLNAGTNTIEVFNSSDQVTIAGQIIGSGTLVKAGAGALALTVANTYSGSTIINGGSIALGSVAGNQTGIGPGAVTFNNGALSMINLQASEVAAWNIIVPTNGVGRLDCDGRCTLTGSLTGGGNFSVMTPYVRTDFSGNWSAFTGQLNLITDSDGGNFRCNNSAGYPSAKINLASLVSLQNRLGGTPTIAIGELSGAPGANISGGTGNDGLAVNWSIGALNTSATFAGNTYNNIGLIKVGTGTWTLTGTNISHTGQTTVNSGTLLINGNAATAAGAVTVATAGTLGGTGSLGGVATVNGNLAPGSNGLGTLSFSNNLTLSASSSTFMEISKAPFASDLAKVQTTLTYGGSLTVTNVGGGTLAAGDSFKLFDASTYAGSFASYALPTLGAGLAWNISALTTSGNLSVIVQTNVVPPAAPTGLIAMAVSAAQINLTWTDNSTNENNFLLERSLDNTNFSPALSVGAGLTNAADPGLTAATLYYYRLRASNSSGNSPYSNIANATTLPAPVALVWHGDGTANAWDVNLSSNWLAAGNSAPFTNGASVLFDDTGLNNVPVALTGSLQPNRMTFDASKNYTLSGTGAIAGNAALIKSGSGQLTINTTNPFSGGITLSNGVIVLGNIGANNGGLGSGPVVFAGGTLQFNGYGGNVGTGWGGLTNTLTVPAGLTGTLLLPPRWGYSSVFNSPLTGGGTLNLTVDFIRDYFSGDWSAFTGQLNVSPRSGPGDFRIDNTKGYVNAAIYLNSGVNLYNINNNNLTIDLGELGGAPGAFIGAGSSSSLNPSWRLGAKNTSSTFAGVIADSGVTSLIKIGGGTLTLTGTNTYSGVTTISNGVLQIGDDGTTGTVGTNNIINNALLAFNRADAITDSGVISGTGSLVQIGDGTLNLSNAHTYSGATLIESGTLALTGNGSIANSANITIFAGALLDVSGHAGGSLTLGSGKTLSGDGSVQGDCTLASGATLEPGNALGALTFNNSLTLAAGSTTRLEVNKAPLANDAVNVSGNLTRGGTLVVTNISGRALAAGDSFPLLNAAVMTGSFSTLILPPLGPNLVWDTNHFLVNGTLAVIGTAPPAFSSVAPLNDGNFRLTFSGPAGRDYELRASPNVLLTPLTLWDLLSGGTFGNSPASYDDLSATNYPQRFYRIVLP